MVIMVAAIVTLVKPVQFLKALSPILTTGLLYMVLGITRVAAEQL